MQITDRTFIIGASHYCVAGLDFV